MTKGQLEHAWEVQQGAGPSTQNLEVIPPLSAHRTKFGRDVVKNELTMDQACVRYPQPFSTIDVIF